MTDFDKINLKNYYELIFDKEKDKIKISDISSPTEVIVSEMLEVLYKSISDYVKEKLDEAYKKEQVNMNDPEVLSEYEADYETRTFDVCVSILQEVIVYNLLRPTKEGNMLVNSILAADIDNVVKDFFTNQEFAKTITYFYIKYIANKSELRITDREEDKVWNANYFIGNLNANKGFSTINDIARDILVDMYADIKEIYGESKELYRMVDEFLISDVRDVYIAQRGIDISDKKYVSFLKQCMVRVILADSYLDIKLTEQSADGIDDKIFSEDDIEAASYVEDIPVDTMPTLPDDFNLRSALYYHFFDYNTNEVAMRAADMDDLKEHEEVKVISKVNPLSFLD